MIKTPLTHEYIETNGIRLHVVQAGPADGPLLILLHGFPEYWQGWRHQIDALAQAGLRVWIPDQRGYNLSDKPKGTAAYNLDELAADVIGLIDAAGEEKALLAGHDWGAAVTWWTANKYPERLHRIGVLNVPHHAVMNRHLRQSRAQLRKSWYMLFFQLPWLPELALRAGNWAGGRRMMKSSSLPHTFSAEDLDSYQQAWAQPGAITGMINWYRAIMRKPPQRLPSLRISVPTLMIWGKQDVALGAEMAQPSIELCDDGRLVFIEEATHWVQHDAPEQVNQLLLDFFQKFPHGGYRNPVTLTPSQSG
ncbi:MAG: alpha/beta fold hydrolase [Anaerolineae bacterium]